MKLLGEIVVLESRLVGSGSKSTETLVKIDEKLGEKRLHNTKEPIIPKCDMTLDVKTFIDEIIILIAFMFNTIT